MQIPSTSWSIQKKIFPRVPSSQPFHQFFNGLDRWFTFANVLFFLIVGPYFFPLYTKCHQEEIDHWLQFCLLIRSTLVGNGSKFLPQFPRCVWVFGNHYITLSGIIGAPGNFISTVSNPSGTANMSFLFSGFS